MKALLAPLVAVLLSGCGGMVLIDQAGQAYPGKFNSATKTLEATIDGTLYSGIYVTNAGFSATSAWAYGRQPAYGSATTMTSGTQGRALLRAADGKTLQCDFSYQGLKAVGQCADNAGRQYQLMTQ